MSVLTTNDLHNLALGSAILGSGGGGDPSYDKMMAQWQFEKYGPVKLLKVENLTPEDLVVPVAFMGAPLVGIEKLPSGKEFLKVITSIEKYIGKKATVLMPMEIGGGNAFTPFFVASQLGLPVLDADMLGRAFPELQMSSCHLNDICPAPAFLADSLGKTVILESGDSFAIEKLARHLTVAMGSCSALAMYLMSGIEASTTVVPGSISQAIHIGEIIAQSQQEGKDPLKPLLKAMSGACLGSGKITDIDQVVSEGFLKGKVLVKNEQETFEVLYQNEYLMASCNGVCLATTPDILMLLEQESGTPLTSESLQYGIQVNLIALPSPPLWQTPKGLAAVGPRYFGYPVDYKPFKSFH